MFVAIISAKITRNTAHGVFRTSETKLYSVFKTARSALFVYPIFKLVKHRKNALIYVHDLDNYKFVTAVTSAKTIVSAAEIL